ncbi:MAG TPA: hypothetical protein VL524_18675 [Gemmatimonadaceae bacterium]|nr:hypothetical protein [Gemmatimonadaceae bacterium]
MLRLTTRPAARVTLALVLLSTASAGLAAQTSAPRDPRIPIDPRLYAGLTWRNLGPFRAGRVAAVSAPVGGGGVFYIGLPAGGVWKTTSAGQVWYPIFDDIKEVSSIGSIEVAPSDPNVIYVGTGDIITGGGINEGNGVYKSTDTGKTWRHLGLDDTKQIPTMLVDPKDPNTVLIGAQGNEHIKSKDRGVFRSTDGGATWTQTLFVDDSTGLQKLARAFDTPSVIFATTVAHYAPPPPPGPPRPPAFGGRGGQQTGPTSTKLFKSTDAGVTWHEITGGGLPARLSGKMWVAVAGNTNAQRVYVIGDWGLYRSDDGGATWRQMAADDQRIRNGQGGYNCGVYVDPENPDLVYTLNTASYVSRDGGKTFTGFKGAPGGDDPQQLWIDPTNGQRMLFGYDQGAIVSLDGGHTWSSWYNQSTEQIYHLATDNSFPYWVYGTQQDAGAIRTRSRGNLGEITPLDWNPVPGWEWGTILPDPLDPNTVYASGSGIVKISYPSEQWINVSPAADPSRHLRSTSDAPMRFAPWNKKMLIAGFQSVWSTVDAGAHWTQMSPDLTLRSDMPAAPAGRGGAPGGNAAIQSMALSAVSPGLIWVGTNNGLIKVTRDAGKTWSDASIPGIPHIERAEVFSLEASNFDPAEAYGVLELFRIGDYTPYVYRTRDYGKTWTRIANGLPENEPSGSFARFVRSDTQRRGLLFAGTEGGAFVSFDDGDHWQTLQQNLPNTSVRDAVIKDNDLVVSTYGRGFWSLDDISMLRQLAASVASEPAHLFKPGEAVRVRRNVGADTPFPPEVPHALNPPEGAIIDYWLARAPSADITLDVLDASGAVVRHLTSAPGTPVAEAARPPEPNFWIAPPFSLPKNDGENRTHWDLRYESPSSFSHQFEINANPGLTPPSPLGALVLPGTYTLKLTVDGKTYSQTMSVKNDPRSPATLEALRAQHALQMKLMQGIEASYQGHRLAQALRDALRGAVPSDAATALGDVSARASALAAQLDTVAGLDAARARGRGFGAPVVPSFTGVNGAFVQQLNAQEQADMAPTAAALAAYAATCQDLAKVAAAWQRLSTTELVAINKGLESHGRPAVAVPAGAMRAPLCR